MYLDCIHRRISELAELGVEIGEPSPAAPAQIAALEQKLHIQVPTVIRELYLWGGNDLGFFAGANMLSVPDHMKLDFRAKARGYLQHDHEDPATLPDQSLITEMDYDGFHFVRADQGDDPPVYFHYGVGPIRCHCERYSDHLGLLIEQYAGIEEIACVDTLAELKRGAQQSARELQHLLFTGEIKFAAIPDDVFSFKELRSLNLVAKGLLELTPRIADLAFLKRLDLARNSLTSLPIALAELDELEDLDLADNQLTSAIAVLQKLPNLRRCNLTANPIAAEEIEEFQTKLPDLKITFSE
jgi:hypothetical protein